METSFCFRVDIDTWEGLNKGLPKCVNLSKKYLFPFSYYLSLGHYATGRNIFRIIANKESLIGKIPIWKRNNWKDLFRGLILPPKKIRGNILDKLHEYEKDDFSEFHSHGYDHVRWVNKFSKFNENQTSNFLDLIISDFKRIFGKHPESNAAPNFVVNPFYLTSLKSKQFKFSSDFIYHAPFLLTYNKEDKTSFNSIVQLPVTETTIETLLIQGKTKMEIVEFYKKRFEELINNNVTYVCMYVHAVFEPMKLQSLIESIFELVITKDMTPIGHLEYYRKTTDYLKIDINNILTGRLKDE